MGLLPSPSGKRFLVCIFILFTSPLSSAGTHDWVDDPTLEETVAMEMEYLIDKVQKWVFSSYFQA